MTWTNYCSDLPESVNPGHGFRKGCFGAVSMDGKPSKKYCDGNDGKNLWYNLCCWWSDKMKKCLPMSLDTMGLGRKRKLCEL